MRVKFDGLLNNQRKYNMSQQDQGSMEDNERIPDAMLHNL